MPRQHNDAITMITEFRSQLKDSMFRKSWKRRLLSAGISLWVCQHCQPVFGAGIQMNGTIHEVIYPNLDGVTTAAKIITNEFVLTLDNEKWECKTTLGDYAELLMFDGTNTYTQHFFPSPPSASGGKPREITTAEIRRGSSSIDGMPGTRVLWMALCGKDFYKSGNAVPIISPWGFPQLLGADSIAYKAEWLDVASMIPRTVQFTMSDVFWKKELAVKHRDESEPKPFKDSELMGEYNVLASTPVNNITVPTKFVLIRYAVNKDKKPVIYEKFEGEIQETHIIEVPLQLARLHMKAQVLDFRFSDDTHKWLNVTYKTPQGEWPATNHPMVISNLGAAIAGYANYEKQLYRSLTPKIDPRKSMTVKRLMLLVFIGPPVIYFLILTRKKSVLRSKNVVETETNTTT
jgi:hypothetical protein